MQDLTPKPTRRRALDLALRRYVLSRWLGWFGIVIAVLLLIPPVGWIALLFLLPLWLVLTSLMFWRAPRTESVGGVG